MRASPGSPADPLPAQLGQSRDRRSLLASSRQVFVVCCGDQRFPGLRSETDRGVLHPHLVPLPGTEGCHPEAVRRIVTIAAPPRSSGYRPLTVRQELNRDPPEAVPEDRLNRGPLPELRVQAVEGSAGS